MRVCNDCLFIVFKMQNYKIIYELQKKNANNANNANNGKVYIAKMTYRSFRKISEKFGRGGGGFLMKKGY